MEDVGLTDGFWRGRRVLLTGHTGFKGSWLLLLLERLGATVTGVSLRPEADGLFEQIGGQRRCVHVVSDIRDFAAVESIMESAAPEVILHLAAQPLVRRSYADPLETVATNVLGTANVLQAARAVRGLQAIVSVTSDKCYANDGRTTGYAESDRLGGHDPYSSSKACAELVTQSFRDSFFAPRDVGVATARAGNVIGGGDYGADRLIPDAVRALKDRRPPELRNPASVRPWQHVLDPLNGYLLLAEKLAADPARFAGAWNFGPSPGELSSVAAVVKQLAQYWNESGEFTSQPGNHPTEADVLTLDSGMSRRELGWRPRLSLAAALDWTAEWYRAQLSGDEPAELCREQIGRYFDGKSVKAAA